MATARVPVAARAEASDLAHPRREHRERADYEVRPADLADELQMGDERDRLKGLLDGNRMMSDEW